MRFLDRRIRLKLSAALLRSTRMACGRKGVAEVAVVRKERPERMLYQEG